MARARKKAVTTDGNSNSNPSETPAADPNPNSSAASPPADGQPGPPAETTATTMAIGVTVKPSPTAEAIAASPTTTATATVPNSIELSTTASPVPLVTQVESTIAATSKRPLRLEWLSPADLAVNPANWRRHPEAQLTALTDVISEVGWAGACLYNERTKRLIDGHARQSVALKQGAGLIPVLVGDWTEEQERKILATLDPLAAMAEADPEKVAALLVDMNTQSAAVQALLDSLAGDDDSDEDDGDADEPDTSPQMAGLQHRVLVECENEAQQTELIQSLEAEGFKCRPLMS